MATICRNSGVRFWYWRAILCTWYAKRQYLLYFMYNNIMTPGAIGVAAPWPALYVYRSVADRKRSCARRYNIIIIERYSFAFRMRDMILLWRNKNILYNTRYEYRTIRPGRLVRRFIPVTSCGPLGSRRRLRVGKQNKKIKSPSTL